MLGKLGCRLVTKTLIMFRWQVDQGLVLNPVGLPPSCVLDPVVLVVKRYVGQFGV